MYSHEIQTQYKKMNILHTADWHLGKKLEQCERTEEHQDFLDWLIAKLTQECIDVLIVAGDVFDTGTPSNTALEQYYRFLAQVNTTCCREVVIIGGNHDSISTLNAPKYLLKCFDVHVMGGVPEVFTEQIIKINDANGNLSLVICAVPFLRDRDIRLSVAGETAEAREERIKQGICNHYNEFKVHIADFKATGIPVLATGHLFAAGSSTSESEKDIHVGNLGQVSGDQFPVEFNYIALGHIHRPQVVNKLEHVRYSGSPIPLSFSENDDRKQVIILEFVANELTRLEPHEVPCTRKLIRIKGNLETVINKVMALEDPQLKYPAWVELQVNTDKTIVNLEEQLEELKGRKPFIERFFSRQIKERASLPLDQLEEEILTLTELDPKAVFLKRCEAEAGEESLKLLMQTFDEVLELMKQKEN
jgi:exonuclease SbcD